MSGNQPGPPSETTRIRDMPAPRLAEGVAAKPMRWAFTWPYRVILLGVYRAGFRPWHLTLLGLVTNVWVGASLLRGQFVLAGLLLIPPGCSTSWTAPWPGSAARTAAGVPSSTRSWIGWPT